MYLRHLRIHHLRNLEEEGLRDLPRISVFHGDNGSGKTSILEAIHLVGMARPFRRVRFQPLIQYHQSRLNVFAELGGSDHHPATFVGIERSRDGANRTYLNQKRILAGSALADVLPLQVIDSKVFELLEGGPAVRRAFMDWGTFHVKPLFRDCWQRACRCVRQRNILLRSASMEQDVLHIWSEELARCAHDIDRMRYDWFDSFTPIFYSVLECLWPEYRATKLAMKYYRGWGDYQLLDKLKSDWLQERATGFTRIGPHRADLQFTVEEHNASSVLSRGQMKLVATALRLAQAEYLYRHSDRCCALLIDDLAAELDRTARTRLCHVLEDTKHQAFISCIELDSVDGLWRDKAKVAVFHVKHGRIDRATHPLDL